MSSTWPDSQHPPPSILWVENSLRENGGLRVSLAHARRLQAAGARTTLALMQHADDGPLARPDPSLTVATLTAPRSRMRYAAPLAAVRLLRLARRASVVVSGSEIGNCLLFGFLAARLARRPFVVLVQADLDRALTDWVPGPLRRPTRWVLARADVAVCVSPGVVAGVLANGLPAERARLVLNGVDAADVRAAAGLPPHPGPDGEPPTARPAAPDRLPTVVAIGRLSAVKGFPLLVRAHARVRADGIDHRLVIMGDGPDRTEIEATVTELGVQESVTLTGFVENPWPEVAGADLFVLSSQHEAFGLTLVEALALGTPIISTACGAGPTGVLEDGRYGRLVPVDSVEALAEAIAQHLEDPAPLRAIAARGPWRALDFDADRSAADLLAVLGEVTAHSGVSREPSPDASS